MQNQSALIVSCTVVDVLCDGDLIYPTCLISERERACPRLKNDLAARRLAMNNVYAPSLDE